jgi:hypothetical protein
VLIFRHYARRFPSGKFWNCSVLFLPAGVATKCAALAPATVRVLREVAPSLSIWEKTLPVASDVDQKGTSWTCGLPQPIKASMTQPSTFVKRSTSRFPGWIGGDSPRPDVRKQRRGTRTPVPMSVTRILGKNRFDALLRLPLTQFPPDSRRAQKTHCSNGESRVPDKLPRADHPGYRHTPRRSEAEPR